MKVQGKVTKNRFESRHFDEWNPLKYKRFRGFHFFTTPIHTPTGI